MWKSVTLDKNLSISSEEQESANGLKWSKELFVKLTFIPTDDVH